MSNSLTVPVLSPQPGTQTTGARGSARRGSDGPSAGAPGFDAVLADHAAPPRSRQTQAKPTLAAQRLSADKHGTTLVSDQAAKAGRALKRTRADVARCDDAAPVAGKQAGPITAEPVHLIAAEATPAQLAEATPAQLAGAPTAPGLGVVPAPSTPVQPDATPSSSVAPVLAPSAVGGDMSAAVAAGDGGAAPGHIEPGTPTAPGLGVAPALSNPEPATTSTGSGIPAMAQAALAFGAASGATGATGAAGDLGFVPGHTQPEATAASTSLPGQPDDPATAAISTQSNQGTDATRPATPPTAAGSGVVPMLSTPVAPTTNPTDSVASVVVPPVDPALAPGAGSGDMTAAVAVGDGRAAPGKTGPDAISGGASSPSQPVDGDTAATSTQPQEGVDATGPAGAPTAASLGVVAALSTPVPPATTSTVSAAPPTGQPSPSSFEAAVHQQVFSAVSPILRGEDGSYGIELRLHPHDLGSVQVNVDVRHGEISIQMHATDPAAREALRDGLPDLRQQLEDQGLRAGSMGVGSGGANARQPETSWSRSQDIHVPRHASLPSDPLVATAGAASSTTLDLRM